jgi:hypothetical protein
LQSFSLQVIVTSLKLVLKEKAVLFGISSSGQFPSNDKGFRAVEVLRSSTGVPLSVGVLTVGAPR